MFINKYIIIFFLISNFDPSVKRERGIITHLNRFLCKAKKHLDHVNFKAKQITLKLFLLLRNYDTYRHTDMQPDTLNLAGFFCIEDNYICC